MKPQSPVARDVAPRPKHGARKRPAPHPHAAQAADHKPQALRLAVALRVARDAALDLVPLLREHLRPNGGRPCSTHCQACGVLDFLRDPGQPSLPEALAFVAGEAELYAGGPAGPGDELLVLCAEVLLAAGRLRAATSKHRCRRGAGGLCDECLLLGALDELDHHVGDAAVNVAGVMRPPPAVDLPPARRPGWAR